MSENIVISISNKIPVSKQIRVLKKNIKKWLDSLERSFNDELDTYQLTKFENMDNEYNLHYNINRNAKSQKRIKD